MVCILICEIQVSCQWLFIPVLCDDGWRRRGGGLLTVFNSTKFERNIALTVLGPDYMSRPRLVSKTVH